ncbi:MAG TPA: GEVED domain-containing protein [Chitinophagaceae bacterium]|nr:GEVED domain-containing protein [Chitinophagaceae bacterium]
MLIILLVGLKFNAASQVTSTFICNGLSGSYQSGSVNSSGIKNDGQMIALSSINNRGWASFDISSIPIGSIITAASLQFTTYSSATSSLTNTCYGFLGNPETMSGTALYAACNSGTMLNSSSWLGSTSTNYLNTKIINAIGLNFIESNLGSSINIGYVRSLSSQFNILGYESSAPPKLVISYIIPTVCSGTPAPGNTTGPYSSCEGNYLNLGMTGSFIGVNNILFQWQRADDSLFISNFEYLGTSSNLITTQSATKYYRCRVTCSNSGLINYSTPIKIIQNIFFDCYCTSSATSNAGEEITNISFGSMNNSSTCTTLAPGAGSVISKYSNYKSGSGAPIPPSAHPGMNTTFSFTQTSCGSSNLNRFYCWIDFNHDGDFLDTDEKVYEGNSVYGSHTDIGTIAIPYSAMMGLTAMRVLNTEGVVNSPCESFAFGEVEDYLIDIYWNDICIFGPPNIGATTGPTSACPNVSFNLNLQNPIGGISNYISYLWQSADDSSFTTNILSIGTTPILTTSQTSSKYYRCKVTCNNFSTFSYSTPLFVNLNTNECSCLSYCQPTTFTGCVVYLTNISFAGINHNSGCGYPYQNFTQFGGGSVIAGSTYPLNYNYSPYYSDLEVVAYFDWNHDGDFEDLNEMYTTSMGMMTGSGNIAVPCNALGGPTRMRVRMALEPTTWSPCATLDWSEAEDYCINVIPNTCNAILNLKSYLQGYYIENGAMNSVLLNQGLPHPTSDCDEIIVELRSALSPHLLEYSFNGTLQTDGTLVCNFPYSAIGNSYYVKVKHRNSIETWSAYPITISAITNYDFTIAANQAYGSNQREMESGVWAFYSGDINQDENIDLLDLSNLENDITNFQFGYLASDINGDGNVDLLDAAPLEININGFVYSTHP